MGRTGHGVAPLGRSDGTDPSRGPTSVGPQTGEGRRKQQSETALAAGYSAENVAYGMGGGLLQQLNRDTQRFAYKVSWVERGGGILPVRKCPSTDPTKASKAGVLDLIRHPDARYETVVREAPGPHPDSALETVFENGELLRHCTLEQVRERAVWG